MRPISFWFPERYARAKELWHNGVSTKKMSIELGVSKAAIEGLARRSRADFPERGQICIPRPKPPPTAPTEPFRRIGHIPGQPTLPPLPSLQTEQD